MNSKVYIILLNYNSADDTIECIESINKNETEVEYEIVVVDNSSQDNSIKKLEKLNNIKLIKSNENNGFASGNNIGIKYAIENGAQYILLLNNDTTIEKNAISILVEQLKNHNELGIIGSRIMYYDNRELINYCGGDINWLKATSIHNNYKEKFNNNIEKFFYTNFITGCCMLIKKEVFEKVGYLPEEYFMYYEDVDFCIKVKEAGYKLGIDTNSVIYHKVSASSGGEDNAFSIKWGTRNRIIFINKYKKYTKGILTLVFFYLTRLIKIVLYSLKNEKEKKEAVLNGIKEGRKFVKEI